MKDGVQDSGRIVQVDGHALWTIQYTKHFHKIDESMLKPFLGKICVVNFDDILIYSSSEFEHLQYLRDVFTVLQANELYINLKMCGFMTTSLIFLDFFVSSQEIHIDGEIVRATLD